MAAKLKLDVQVKIKGSLYQLVEDSRYVGLDCCDHCALLGNPCAKGNYPSLTALCAAAPKSNSAYFEEVIW